MRKVTHAIAVALAMMATGAMAADTDVSACGTAPYISRTNTIYSQLYYGSGVIATGNTIESVTAKINYDPPSIGTLQIRLCHLSLCTAWQSYTNPNFTVSGFAPQDPSTSPRMEARVTYSANRTVQHSGKQSCATVRYNYPS